MKLHPLLLLLLLGACADISTEGDLETAEAAACTDPDVLVSQILPERSLAITDPAVIGDSVTGPFRLDAVLRQLVRQANPALTDASAAGVAQDLYQQWWGSFDVAGADPTRPRCDMPDPRALPGTFGPSFNGFGWQCPRGERDFAFSPLTAWTPIALFYRPDLMPPTALNCGEARIVYARDSGSFAIFEAKIPNPTPGCSEGCRRVGALWASFSLERVNGQRLDPLTIRNRLTQFYMTGTAIRGLGPVIHIDNLAGSQSGGYASSSGQVRTNAITNGPWELKEFAVRRISSNGPRRIEMRPQTDKVNPSPRLFADLPTGSDPTSTELRARMTTFRNQFVASDVEKLAFGDLNTFTMEPADTANSGSSRSGFGEPLDPSADYRGAGSQMRALIQARLDVLRTRPTRPLANPSITTDVILARATAMSCGGCHFNANGAFMGNSPTGQPMFWPADAGFVHVRPSPGGLDVSGGTSGFTISPALTGTFLPARAGVLVSLLNQTRCLTCPTPSPSPSPSGSPFAQSSGGLHGGAAPSPSPSASASASPAPSPSGSPAPTPAPALAKPEPWSATIGGRTVH